MDKRILVTCPMRDRAWVLPHYLDALYNLDYDKKLIDIFWLVNNSKDETLDMLIDYKNKFEYLYHSITIQVINDFRVPKDDRITQIRQQVYPWLAMLRNRLLDKCVELQCDYIFSCDSDIIFKPDTLKRLLGHNLDIISGLIYNSYLHSGIELGYKHCNILKEVEPRRYQHIVNYRVKFPEKNQVGTLIENDYTGAIFLATQEVCQRTRYDSNEVYGEDEPWSYSARMSGYKLFCDVSVFSYHCMSPEVLNYFLKNNWIKGETLG
jgi:cellulose synthase/poly-beta-1,6-N-acetylglucosamine synthase-like glycosyltransferase